MNQPQAQNPKKPPRRRGRTGRIIRRILVLLMLAALVFVAIRYWPYIYQRFFGNNTQYVSERFSEVVKEQNRMEVCSVTIDGQETVSMDAFLIGTVQQVVIPYSFTVGYFVDYDEARIAFENNTITVSVPEPYADYHKLTVDEENVKKSDFLVPLTTERYAQIVGEIEDKLFAECADNQEYLYSAWSKNVDNLKAMFTLLLDQLNVGTSKSYDIRIVKLPRVSPTEQPTALPSATPAQ